MTFLVYLGNLTSNALAMVTALQRYGPETTKWGPPQTERDGYWGGDGGPSNGLIRYRKKVPRGLSPNAEVCKRKCKYQTVQSAVDAAPVNGPGRFVIHIKQGVYEETVRVSFHKKNVVFLGDGMGKTVITGNLSVGPAGVSTYNTATVGKLSFWSSNDFFNFIITQTILHVEPYNFIIVEKLQDELRQV